ncbi:PREDICTED: mas-related G-protein coupled receptor member H-like [Pseudopodoces humilis]|uniref:mas-related G-protein coupled receptor member H-like n=1 Tax=Pseudopodoces humilis TaxID=181119 RepID=UPI000395910C|nr:PREDICTED: mas-related G-protein coupled receptor member H-like [Pseudopodoces humilis]
MEVTTVFPPPASPTEGDNLCETDVTDVAIDSVTLLICLCGLVGNGAVICLLQRNPTTFYAINLAFANFTFLHFVVPSTLLYLKEELSCSTIMPLVFLRALFPLLLFSYNLGLYLLTAISIDRCISILYPLWYHCHRPKRLSWVVCALLWALSIAVIAMVTSLCLSHEHEHCQVALISMYALNLFLFAPAMVISSTVLLTKIKCGSQQQQPKRLNTVTFIVVLFFLLFALPLSLSNFLQQFGYTTVSSQVVFLLTCIHSTINPFIYFLAGRCWRCCSLESLRLSLQRIFEEPEENTAHINEATRDTANPAC